MKGRSLKFLGLGLGEIRPAKFSNIGGAGEPAARRGSGAGGDDAGPGGKLERGPLGNAEA